MKMLSSPMVTWLGSRAPAAAPTAPAVTAPVTLQPRVGGVEHMDWPALREAVGKLVVTMD